MVCRGLLSVDGEQDLPVVAKFAVKIRRTTERFTREARIYQDKLRDLQGHSIPSFYGMYEGSTSSDDVLCLLLEDCGECIDDFGILSMFWRYVHETHVRWRLLILTTVTESGWLKH